MRDEKLPAVYIMADRYRGTLYIGVTSNLWSRVWDHKNGTTPGFTSKYGLKTLVWYEHHGTMDAAIRRETQMKAWKRDWKIRKSNPSIPNGLIFTKQLIPLQHSWNQKRDPSIRWGDG